MTRWPAYRVRTIQRVQQRVGDAGIASKHFYANRKLPRSADLNGPAVPTLHDGVHPIRADEPAISGYH